jgi:hypothetical protein
MRSAAVVGNHFRAIKARASPRLLQARTIRTFHCARDYSDPVHSHLEDAAIRMNFSTAFSTPTSESDDNPYMYV